MIVSDSVHSVMATDQGGQASNEGEKFQKNNANYKVV